MRILSTRQSCRDTRAFACSGEHAVAEPPVPGLDIGGSAKRNLHDQCFLTWKDCVCAACVSPATRAGDPDIGSNDNMPTLPHSGVLQTRLVFLSLYDDKAFALRANADDSHAWRNCIASAHELLTKAKACCVSTSEMVGRQHVA